MASLTDGDWPEGGTEPVPNCPVCGSAERRVLYEDLTDRVYRSAPGSFTLKQCSACQSAYLDPRPTADTLWLAYRSYVTHHVEDTGEFAHRSLRGKIFESLTNGYLNSRYGFQQPNAAAAGRWAVPLAFSLAAHMDTEARHIPKPVPGNDRLLDFGCGAGKFLEMAQQAGWTVSGIDVDPEAVATAKSRGIDATTQSLGDLVKAGRQFDYITACHVIEHLYDPKATLADCFKLLRSGGTLWIDTPNIQSLGHDRFGRDWMHLDPPRHLVMFTPASLERLVGAAGFSALQRGNRALYILYTYADCRQLAAAGKIEPPVRRTLFDAAIWADGATEYFRPDVRESLTLVCQKP